MTSDAHSMARDPIGRALSVGLGGVAEFLYESWNGILDRLRATATFGVDVALNDLARLSVECGKPDWDGYGAVSVSAGTIENARQCLLALPLGISSPAVGAEPDGQITLEWYSSPNRTLSVSISHDGDLHYAAILGPASQCGTEPFLGQFPANILNLVNRVARK